MVLGCGAVAAPLAAQQPEVKRLPYPETAKTEVTDDYHGTIVADPYRWLEDTESEQTAAWIEAQNEVTRAYLDSLPRRDVLRQRLTELWNYERYGTPVRRGENYFFTHNDGLQDQSVLYTAPSLEAERRVLIDPNQLSEDGTVALAGWAPSEDGELLAYGLADGGSDWRTWKVRDVASGEDLQDTIEWVKFSGIAWLPDASGFFYARYDAPQEGEELTATNQFQKLYFHRLGTPQSEDRLVYERPDHPKWGFRPAVTEDGRYLVISVWKGTEPVSQILLKDLQQDDGPVRPLLMGFDAEYDLVGSDGETLFFLTDLQAPKRRVVAVSAAEAGDPEREDEVAPEIRSVVAETEDVLESVNLLGDRFFALYLKDARGLATIYDLDGDRQRDVALPGVGTVRGFGGRRDARETFFTFTNYVTPPSIYRFDLESDEQTLWRRPEVALDSSQFETEQVFYESKDGTRVPMIITYKKGLRRDGTNPTLLYGYGGFNISLTPGFSPGTAGWLDAGGVFAVPNLRGGGEYGRDWHEAGMLDRKQNVFDDFIAAAEYLIREKYTSSEHLGIRGGSNGGLLVGAVMTQRPDLFGACLPAVGVMDMLRFHKFTIGWAWVSEYGSSDDPEQFENLYRYSPLHNLRDGTCYPPTLVTTADRDDRVVPGHSFKFAARLQEAQGCENPVLIRIETRAGHGAGTPVSKSIDQYTDLWSFLFANLE
jgi:prolyl oligopeptidase